jgi:uncharacterized protein YciI
LFIISLTYRVPLEKVDEARNDHLEFLEKCYEKSIFLASGPKVPRTGGIILADHVTKEELEEIIKEDPFYQKQIAEYEITEFTPTMSTLP